MKAWLIAQVARLFAPLIANPKALRWAIAKSREYGPAYPPDGYWKKICFRDEARQGARRFEISPAGGPSSPVHFLYLHGGAHVLDLLWIQWRLVAGLLKRVAGEMTIPIYPLAPEAGWRESTAHVLQAYERLASRHDPRTIVVIGDSSGGGLALLLAQALRDARRPLPAALILFSPWLDLSMSGADQAALERRDPWLTRETARQPARLWAQGLALDDPRVSPLFGDHSLLPPTLVFSSDRDLLHSDALRLSQLNPEIVHRAYPGMLHVWPAGPFRESRRALDEAAAFVARHTIRDDRIISWPSSTARGRQPLSMSGSG